MAYLELRHMTKRFGTLLANDDISLSVEKGEIHALLGENGAGKSTLMNILYGMYSQSEGDIFLDGERLVIRSPKDAIAHGIGMVHQHFMLVQTLTVIENVMLGYKQTEKEKLDLSRAAERFSLMAEKYGMTMSPWVKVSSLTIGEQQRLEILKALFRESKLLILDEPTAVLTPQETVRLFDLLHQLTVGGLAIIFITHKLAEVMDICNNCTVLRQGRVAATLNIAEITSYQQLASLMVGRDVDLVTHKREMQAGENALELRDISYTDSQKLLRVDHVNLAVRSGEIVGIAGVDGNGQSELVRCITGLLSPDSGQILLKGEPITGLKPKEILRHKVSHIPEDRQRMAMVKQMTVNENLILMSYDQAPWCRFGFLNWRKIKMANEALCMKYDVKTPDVNELVSRLSGGNQQKLVVGRELERKPDLLVAVYPDRGLDIGATKYIQSRLVEERDRGGAILLVSTELDEIMELSDRILVLYQGRIMGELSQKAATREKIGLLMAGICTDGGTEPLEKTM